MRRNEQNPSPGRDRAVDPTLIHRRLPPCDIEEGINNGVARDPYGLCAHALPEQIGTVQRSRRKVKIRQLCRQAAVDLFGIWRPPVVGAQPGLDMNYRNLVVKSGERGREGRGGIALHDYRARAASFEVLRKAVESSGRDPGQGLSWSDDV